ncbi:DAK2 domain-containing protein [Ditylenchus destructor]|nr:DAK2 domain-containing protein [Ditylenchus destructor]
MLFLRRLKRKRDRLSELDGAIGDGDHGTTMALGFQAVRSELSKLNLNETDISTVLNTAATAFINASVHRLGRFMPQASAVQRRQRRATTILIWRRVQSSLRPSALVFVSEATDSVATRQCLMPGCLPPKPRKRR